MVQVQKYLTRTNDFQQSRHFPLLNSLFVDQFSMFSAQTTDQSFKTFMKWARKSPHILGLINIIASDILSDNIEFIPIDKGSGRNRVKKAEEFFYSNRGREVIEEMLYDFLINGVGYGWLGSFNEKELREFCKDVTRKINKKLEVKSLEIKSKDLMERIKSKSYQELAQKFRHVAASTVSPHSDEYKIKKYIQRVGVNTKVFTEEEIIRIQYMPFDGKVSPFPPMEALLADVYLLWLITQNYVSFFENGGHPDNVFILPKELAGSKNHDYLIETLKKYKKIQNKHGNLVFTGEIEIEQLMKAESQMEHKELSLYITGVLAMFYGIPVSRIPFLIGKAANEGDSGGLADSGYWRKISVWQTKIEDPFNEKLWIPYYGVRMKFKRGYLQDEVRETQNDMQKTSVVEQRLSLGLITVNEAGKYLGIDEEEIKEAQEEKKKRDAEEMKTGMLRQNLENNRNVIPNQDNRTKAKTKQATQLNKQSTGGKRINV